MTRTKWRASAIFLGGMLLVLTACNLSDIMRRQIVEPVPDTRVILQAGNCSPHADVNPMIKTQQIVQQRLSGLGIDKAKVEVQDACHLVIELHAPDNLDRVLDTVRQTGRLEIVDAGSDFYAEGAILRTTGNPSPTLSISNTFATTIPDKVYQAIITGADFLPEESKVVLGGYDSQQPEVAFKLETTAAQRFKEFTSAYNEQALGRQYFLCIVLDNRVESCPSIRSPIPDGVGVITPGQGGIDEANRLVNLLRFGSLPYELEVIQIESLPPEGESKP